ncbi:LuxR family two component transcriptional regulator [Chitinophaga skermanii]|uniref:LuxR family two component transcriptional regulator n=1 Tax=Chitinophaga skermanii TaxID=331697 RepID=A0A327QXR5_9BACT|nr:response regulator transcription factor [Chitinophaga skermanii]RAJ08183.1 LuxR family two component transcriptional regulator [Chitinophaga skermanii]
MLTGNVKLAIVDDHPIVLEGLQRLIAHVPEITMVGTFTEGAPLLDYIRTNQVDILLLDISLPGENGMEICKEVKRISPQTQVLALSNHAERSMILQMLQHGATGYLLKNIAPGELVACIAEAQQGLLTFSKAAKEIMARPSSVELKGIPQLTKREKEILHWIAEGRTTPQIAEQLNVSPLTVETHRRNLIQKFAVPNVAALIKVAAQQGFI